MLNRSFEVDFFAHEASLLEYRVRRHLLRENEREQLAGFQRRLRRGRPPFMLEWDWFDDVDAGFAT